MLGYLLSIVWVKICALLGYYAARSGNSVPTFRDNLSSDLKGPRSSEILGLCVISQTIPDFVYVVAEAWNHTLRLVFKAGQGRPFRLQDVEAPRICRHSAQEVARVSALRTFFPSSDTPGTNFCSGRLDHMTTVLAAQCLNQLRYPVQYVFRWERNAETSGSLLDVLLKIIEGMLIIIQYAKLALTKLKSRDINTADCCYMPAIIWQLHISCCYWLPFWSEYSPQLFPFQSSRPWFLRWTITFKTSCTHVRFLCKNPLSVCHYATNCWSDSNICYFFGFAGGI